MADKNDPVVTYTTPDYTEKYSNNVMAESRMLDFRLRFGVGVYPEPGSDSPLMVEYFQAILLSPQEAKLLALWLYQEVRRYEECFGTIPTEKPAAPAEAAAEPDAAAAPAPAEVIQ
jgi:hypothetical protein